MNLTKEKRKRSLLHFALMIILIVSRIGYLGSIINPPAVMASDLGRMDMYLGTQGIGSPSSTSDSDAYWKGSRIYYGNEGILWRVLDREGLLFADDVLFARSFHFEEDEVTWDRSSIRSYLNGTYNELQNYDYSGTGYIDTQFTSQEADAIKVSYVEHSDSEKNDAGEILSGGGDTWDKIYLLSMAEATRSVYGLASAGARVKSDGSNTLHWWYLRTKGKKTVNQTYINSNGKRGSSGYSVHNDNGSAGEGIRPAFQLDMNHVVSILAADVNKADYGSFGEARGEIKSSSRTPENWKLTLKGTEESLEIEKVNETFDVSTGRSIEIIHKPARSIMDASQVSGMILDQTGSLIYYGSINHDVDASSSIIPIPTGLAYGNYTLRVFAEKVNGGNRTDYASGFSDLSIIVGEVQDVTDLPSQVMVGTSTLLTGTIVTQVESDWRITFHISDPGTTEAIVEDNVFRAEKPGKAELVATVEGGLYLGRNFEKVFSIEVTADPEEKPSEGEDDEDDEDKSEDGDDDDSDEEESGDDEDESEDNDGDESGDEESKGEDDDNESDDEDASEDDEDESDDEDEIEDDQESEDEDTSDDEDKSEDDDEPSDDERPEEGEEPPVDTEPPSDEQPPVDQEPPVVGDPPVDQEPPVVEEPPADVWPPADAEPPADIEPPIENQPPVTMEPPTDLDPLIPLNPPMNVGPAITTVPPEEIESPILEPPVCSEPPAVTEPPVDEEASVDLELPAEKELPDEQRPPVYEKSEAVQESQKDTEKLPDAELPADNGVMEVGSDLEDKIVPDRMMPVIEKTPYDEEVPVLDMNPPVEREELPIQDMLMEEDEKPQMEYSQQQEDGTQWDSSDSFLPDRGNKNRYWLYLSICAAALISGAYLLVKVLRN